MESLWDVLEEIVGEMLQIALASGDKARIKRIKATQKKLRKARDKRTGIEP